MTSYSCNYCNKSYIRKSAFNNHQLNCELTRICNNVKTNYQENKEETELDIKFNGTINDVYKLLINLNNKFEKLETDYNELKKYATVCKNKIDIIEHLNKNFQYSDFNFDQFINSILITDIELQIIYEKDYIDGIFQIIVNHIEKIKHDSNIPIKAFNNKEGVLYIYLNSLDNSHNWVIVDEDRIKSIMKYFDKKLLPLFIQWKDYYQLHHDPNDFTLIYVKNMKRVLGSNFEKKNKNAMLQNKLYKYLKINLKNFIQDDFT
tara:strand:- start:20387 stop:21172 length:786 start_codon:yes stop_codon:yes gene_type:complete